MPPAPDLSTYGGATFAPGFEGQIADQESAQITSLTNSNATAINFGVAVVRDATAADGRSCRPQAGDTDLVVGISVRSPILNPASTDGLNTVNYPQYSSVGVLVDGVIFVKAAEDVRQGDQVISLTAGGAGNTSAGALGGSKGGVAGTGRLDVPGATWEEDVASGAVGKVRIKSAGTRRTTT